MTTSRQCDSLPPMTAPMTPAGIPPSAVAGLCRGHALLARQFAQSQVGSHDRALWLDLARVWEMAAAEPDAHRIYERACELESAASLRFD